MENEKHAIDLRKMNPLRAGAVAQAVFERWMEECQPWRKTISAFASDFAIADAFGKNAVKDTFERAFGGMEGQPGNGGRNVRGAEHRRKPLLRTGRRMVPHVPFNVRQTVRMVPRQLRRGGFRHLVRNRRLNTEDCFPGVPR